MTTFTCSNLKDTGSLHVGTSKDLKGTLNVGDKIKLDPHEKRYIQRA